MLISHNCELDEFPPLHFASQTEIGKKRQGRNTARRGQCVGSHEVAQKQQILSTQEVTGSALAYSCTVSGYFSPTDQNPTRIPTLNQFSFFVTHCPIFQVAHFQESKEFRKVPRFQIKASQIFFDYMYTQMTQMCESLFHMTQMCRVVYSWCD